MTAEGSVGCSHTLQRTECQVKLSETGFTEHDANNQHVVKKLKSKQHPASVDQSLPTTDPSIDCSSPTGQQMAAEVHQLKNGEAPELPKSGGETGPMNEGDEFLHSHMTAMSADSAAEDIAVLAAEVIALRHLTYSITDLNATSLFHDVDFRRSRPKITKKQLQSTSSEQPVGKEETGDPCCPTTPEISGLSVSPSSIGRHVSPIMEGRRLLDVWSSSCEVDESHSQPEEISAVGGLVEEIDDTMQPPAHQDEAELVEPPPGTTLNAVSTENVFLSGDWDDESISLGEEPSLGSTLDDVTTEYVFSSVADYDGESMTLGDGEPGNICRICLDSCSNCALCPCGHFACLPCINQWRTVRPVILTCHICRQVVEEVLTF